MERMMGASKIFLHSHFQNTYPLFSDQLGQHQQNLLGGYPANQSILRLNEMDKTYKQIEVG